MQRLAVAVRPRVWWLLALLLAMGTAYIWGCLVIMDTDLKSSGGGGIVGLELATLAGRARAIVQTWAAHDVLDVARQSVRLDLAFIIFYVGTLVVCFFAVTGSVRNVRGYPIALFALLPLSAGALDLMEDAGLWWIMGQAGDVGWPLPLVVALFAATKFLLLIAAVIVLAVLVLRLRKKTA